MEPEQIESAAINSTDEALDLWAFVEIMGHSKLAGRLTTRKVGVSVLLQVDVLKPDGSATAFSKLFNPASIFSITPVEKVWCQKWSAQAQSYDFKPVPYIEDGKPRQLAGYTQEDDEDEDRD